MLVNSGVYVKMKILCMMGQVSWPNQLSVLVLLVKMSFEKTNDPWEKDPILKDLHSGRWTPLDKGETSSKPSFQVSMLILGGVNLPIPMNACLEYHPTYIGCVISERGLFKPFRTRPTRSLGDLQIRVVDPTLEDHTMT